MTELTTNEINRWLSDHHEDFMFEGPGDVLTRETAHKVLLAFGVPSDSLNNFNRMSDIIGTEYDQFNPMWFHDEFARIVNESGEAQNVIDEANRW